MFFRLFPLMSAFELSKVMWCWQQWKQTWFFCSVGLANLCKHIFKLNTSKTVGKHTMCSCEHGPLLVRVVSRCSSTVVFFTVQVLSSGGRLSSGLSWALRSPPPPPPPWRSVNTGSGRLWPALQLLCGFEAVGWGCCWEEGANWSQQMTGVLWFVWWQAV